MKVWLKRSANISPILSLSLARLNALLLGILALRYRIFYTLRCHIAWSARVIGWSAIEFGDNVVLGAGSWLNVNHRGMKSPTLRIGSNSFIGRNNFFTVGRSIVVREYCLTASNCAFIGSSHVAVNPLSPYATTGTTSEDCIYIGVNCFFGYGATVIGNVNIGHGSIIGAGVTVREDIPPFSLVVGTPSRVVRRYCFDRQSWIKPGESTQIKFPAEDQYLRELCLSAKFPLQPVSAAVTFFGDI